MIELCSSADCTGCGACHNACPVSAIVMQENDWAESVPSIDHSRCIECGRCQRACPVLTPAALRDPRACFAAWSSDVHQARKSSSGGIASALAAHVIQHGGIVVGAALGGDLRVRHTVAETLDQAERLRGSKYTQSDIGLVFRYVGEYLDSGRRVLFVGTPCQVAGIHGYLGRAHRGLVTVDLVCHGVPPARYLSEHVASLAPNTQSVGCELSFRDERGFRMLLRDASTVVYDRPWVADTYYRAFMKGLTYRESCYHCSYAGLTRCSDITLGDFWGLDRGTLSTTYDGRISLVLANTEPGASLLAEARPLLRMERRSLGEAAAGNPQLRAPSVPHPRRSEFRSAYPAHGFVGAMRRSGMRREVLIAKVKHSGGYRLLHAAKVFVSRRTASRSVQG